MTGKDVKPANAAGGSGAERAAAARGYMIPDGTDGARGRSREPTAVRPDLGLGL